MLIPPRQELRCQIPIGVFEGTRAGHPQTLHQPVLWAVPKLRSTRPLACGECAAIQTMPNSRNARPICVGGKGSRLSRGRSLKVFWPDFVNYAKQKSSC